MDKINPNQSYIRQSIEIINSIKDASKTRRLHPVEIELLDRNIKFVKSKLNELGVL